MGTRLGHPFTCVVGGPTGCGKTMFVIHLQGHSSTLINLLLEMITWCYEEWQPLYFTLSTTHENIGFVMRLPDRPSMPKPGT